MYTCTKLACANIEKDYGMTTLPVRAYACIRIIYDAMHIIQYTEIQLFLNKQRNFHLYIYIYIYTYIEFAT